MNKFLTLALGSAAALALAASAPASANTLVLEGSDATSYHQDAAYSAQLFGYLKGASALPVLVYGGVSISGAPAGTVYSTSLAGLNTANYSAVYLQSTPGGCCDDAYSAVNGDASKANLASFYAAGGSVSIGNYEGNAGWGTLLGFAGLSTITSADIGGYGGGAGGSSCFDTETFLPGALAAGFSQPGSLGCWGHQSYKMTTFGALGFNNLVESNNGLGKGWSSFLALGGVLGGGGVPEPATWALMLMGFGAIGASLRDSRRRRAAAQA